MDRHRRHPMRVMFMVLASTFASCCSAAASPIYSALTDAKGHFDSPETRLWTANPRECRHSSEYRKRQAGDHCGWLGISDSNLEMSESKSRRVAPVTERSDPRPLAVVRHREGRW
jgi:hypothetical protein